MLKKLLVSIIKTAFKIGGKKLEGIKNVIYSRLAILFVSSGEKVTLALLDDDKDNEEQIKKIIQGATIGAIDSGTEIAREKLVTLKDKKLAAALMLYVNGSQEVLKALIDEDTDNESQLLEIWNRRKKELLGDGFDILTDKVADLVRDKIQDPELAGGIIEILASLDDVVKGK